VLNQANARPLKFRATSTKAEDAGLPHKHRREARRHMGLPNKAGQMEGLRG